MCYLQLDQLKRVKCMIIATMQENCYNDIKMGYDVSYSSKYEKIRKDKKNGEVGRGDMEKKENATNILAQTSIFSQIYIKKKIYCIIKSVVAM